MVDASQAWFFAATWLEGEAAASADIAAGRTTVHTWDGDFLAAFWRVVQLVAHFR